MSKIRRLGPTALLQLHIELEHSQPLIWRAVSMPDNITLVKLHSVIQAAMGWWGVTGQTRPPLTLTDYRNRFFLLGAGV